MKKISFTLLFLIYVIGMATAQSKDVAKMLKVPDTYNRSSVTLMVLDFPGDYHYNFVRNNLKSLVFSDKYYNNNLNYITLNSPYERSYIGANKADLILKSLNEKRVANDIVAKWYSMDSQGKMSLDLVHSRGMFNATDEAYLEAKTTKRGNAQLEDFGNRLIDMSYVVVADFYDIKSMEEAKVKDSRGWQASVQTYLYKIDFNEEIRNKIYDNWIYDEDTPEVKDTKRIALSKIEIPLVFVTTSMNTASESVSTKTSSIPLVGTKKPKTDDELMAKMIQDAYNEILYNLEMKVEDFKVITSINGVNPLRAKIGKKEGIKTDYRFFAYEYVYDEKSNLTTQKLRGVVRSTPKIADNVQVATGKSPTTEFYQTCGRRLQTGYLLQQRNDFGGELSAGYEIGEIGGIYGRLDLRMGRYVGVKALFLYIEGGYESKEYNTVTFKFTRYGGGLAKGLQLTRNSELRPYVGIGLEETKNAAQVKQSTVYFKGGANLGINIKHNVQLFGGVGYYMTGDTKDENDVSYGDWDIVYDGRGGMSILAGIRIGF